MSHMTIPHRITPIYYSNKPNQNINEILGHPNVKAFISHGGLLGTIESVHCGVPMVLLPQLGDQHTNSRALESIGGGIVLNLKDITEDTVYKALTTVLSPE